MFGTLISIVVGVWISIAVIVFLNLFNKRDVSEVWAVTEDSIFLKVWMIIGYIITALIWPILVTESLLTKKGAN